MPWKPDFEEDDPPEGILATASAVSKDVAGEGGYPVQVNTKNLKLLSLMSKISSQAQAGQVRSQDFQGRTP